MQNVEDAIELLHDQRIDQRWNTVDRMRIDAARTQCVEHVTAGFQRHFALGAGAAHQHGDATEIGRVFDARDGE